MADISSVEEAINAEKVGFDIVGTTLVGYTEYTKGNDPVTELEKVIKAAVYPSNRRRKFRILQLRLEKH